MEKLNKVSKILIVINVLLFCLSILLENFFGYNINKDFGLYYIENHSFRHFQIISNIFLHANLFHLFFNMFGIYNFGNELERRIGPKKYLATYIITGMGGNILHQFFLYLYKNFLITFPNTITINDESLAIFNTCSIGASGSIYGLFTFFALLMPYIRFNIFFIPYPIKAINLLKAVIFIEFTLGIYSLFSSSIIGHFAHLGGIVTCFILIKTKLISKF